MCTRFTEAATVPAASTGSQPMPSAKERLRYLWLWCLLVLCVCVCGCVAMEETFIVRLFCGDRNPTKQVTPPKWLQTLDSSESRWG